MSENEFWGLLIGAIATLLTIASLVAGLIVRPIINLNKSITKLNDNIEGLNKDTMNLEKRVAKHGEEINANREHLIIHDKEIEFLKRSKGK